MKKIISIVICVFILLFSINAFAAEDFVKVKYDFSDGTVSVTGRLDVGADTPVTVYFIKADDPVPSDGNKPAAMFLITTGKDGALDFSRVFAENVLPSGAYLAVVSSGNTKISSEFSVYNANSEEYANVLKEINSAYNSGRLASFLKENRNIEKIGYMCGDTEPYLVSIAEFCIQNRNKNGKNYTADTISGAINYALLIASVKAGVPLDECLVSYGGSIGYTADDYAALSEKEKTELLNLLKESDYISSGIKVSFEDMIKVVRARLAAETWGTLLEFLTANPGDYDINMGSGSDYISVAKVEIQYVYEDMRPAIKKAMYPDDVKDAFDKACKDYVEQKASDSRISKSSRSSSGGGSAAMPVRSVSLEELPDYTGQGVSAVPDKFSDIADHFSKEAVNYLADKKIINGYEDGTFMPDNTVTRAEAAAMIYRIIKADSAKKLSGFSDVSEDDWFAEAVYALSEKGIIMGTDTGEFLPFEFITRQDIAAIIERLAEAMEIDIEGEGENFNDFDEVSDYAKSAVSSLSANGIIQGFEGYFRPLDTCTRGEIAVILYRCLSK